VTARWSVLAGSTSGAAHDRAGVSSQDAFAVEEIGGTLVVAVADGAGSAAFAATGAALVVSLAVRELARLLPASRPADQAQWASLVRAGADRTLYRFRGAVAGLARGAGLQPQDFGTTVTVVLARVPWVGVFAVGDGFVVTRAAGAGLDLLLAPPGGTARAPGATTLLPGRRRGDRTRRRVARLPDLTGLAVGTDGLETLVIEFAAACPVRPAAEPFERLFAMAGAADTDDSALTRMLAGRRVGELSSDDRTLVLAVPR
jgi:Protein phosphatase 2C